MLVTFLLLGCSTRPINIGSATTSYKGKSLGVLMLEKIRGQNFEQNFFPKKLVSSYSGHFNSHQVKLEGSEIQRLVNYIQKENGRALVRLLVKVGPANEADNIRQVSLAQARSAYIQRWLSKSEIEARLLFDPQLAINQFQIFLMSDVRRHVSTDISSGIEEIPTA